MTDKEHEQLQKTYQILRECKKRAETIETFKADIEALRLANSGMSGSGPNVTGIRVQQVEFDNITYVHTISEMEKKIAKASEENNKVISDIFKAVDDPKGVSILLKYYFYAESSVDSIVYEITKKGGISRNGVSKTTFERKKREAVVSLMNYYSMTEKEVKKSGNEGS